MFDRGILGFAVTAFGIGVALVHFHFWPGWILIVNSPCLVWFSWEVAHAPVVEDESW